MSIIDIEFNPLSRNAPYRLFLLVECQTILFISGEALQINGLKTNTHPPTSRTSGFGNFYPYGMKKNCVIDPSRRDLNPLWKCIVTPLEALFPSNFPQLALWNK
jgi:hypothetical protein